MTKIRWVVQSNLTSEDTYSQIEDACRIFDYEFYPLQVIPFADNSKQIPIDPSVTNIYYGSTTLIRSIYNNFDEKGLFFNEEFLMSNYLDKWGDLMLNHGCAIVSVEYLVWVAEKSDMLVFSRPDTDYKDFSGQVTTVNELKEMLARAIQYESELSTDSRILIGAPKNIINEWRSVVVDGKVAVITKYKDGDKLVKEPGAPDAVINFIENAAKIYSPHKIYAMDIAETDNSEYKILECGCANAVGTYGIDVRQYVKSISETIQDKQ